MKRLPKLVPSIAVAAMMLAGWSDAATAQRELMPKSNLLCRLASLHNDSALDFGEPLMLALCPKRAARSTSEPSFLTPGEIQNTQFIRTGAS